MEFPAAIDKICRPIDCYNYTTGNKVTNKFVYAQIFMSIKSLNASFSRILCSFAIADKTTYCNLSTRACDKTILIREMFLACFVVWCQVAGSQPTFN